MLALLALCGCRLTEAEEFNPTALGYNLSRTVEPAVSEAWANVERMLHLSEYIEAGEDEREAVCDEYFYDVRIVERDVNVWQLINSRYSVTICTDGRPLTQTGAEWTYRHSGREYVDEEFPTVRCVAADKYEVHVPQHGCETFYGDFSLKVEGYDVTVDGQTVRKPSVVCECEYRRGWYYNEVDNCHVRTLKPLKYLPENGGGLTEGRVSMTVTLDGETLSPEAEFASSGRVTVWGGAGNAYQKEYGWEYYYW